MTLQPTSPARRSALAGALLLIALAVSGAQAACLTVNPDQPPPALSGDWCITAAVRPSQQTPFDWPNESLVLGTLTFETLPGQLGSLSLVSRSDGREIWKGTVTGEGATKSRPLLLVPGDYGITITAGPTPLVYRAEITEPRALPGELPASVAGEFEGLLRGTGAEFVVPWTVPEADQAGLWTLEVQAPIGASMTTTLRDSTGNIVVYTGAADGAGTFRLPDLDPMPGTYTLGLSAPAAGTPLIAAARFEPRPAGFATEPDDLPEQAHPFEPEVPAVGRLAGGGTARESDYFALTVPEGATRMYDITLSASSAAPLNLALTDDTGRYRAHRDGTGTVALHNLVLPPGRHLLKVTGVLPPEATYTLLAGETGTPTAGQETEPNNEPIDANHMPRSGSLTGAFEGTDSEYLVLGVTGGLQLWDIEASGEGASRLSLYDAAQRLIAATGVRSGAVLRLDRMLLPPGANIVRLEGSDGSWLLRAKPAGDVVAGEEYESNDHAARALVLPFGEPQTGWLQRADDNDIYAFHLAAWQRVAIAVTGPTGVPVAMSLAWDEASNRIADVVGLAAARGEAGLVWQGLLPPGDFLVDLRPAAGRSREPYTILLESPSFFDRPLDLEPNDEIWQLASAAAAGNLIEGTLDGRSADWFLLPVGDGGQLVVTADALPGPVEVSLAHGDSTAPQTGEVSYLYRSGETARFNPPPGAPLYLGVRGSTGPYRLSLGPAQTPPPALPIEAELSFEPAAVAAFEEVAQRLRGTLVIKSEAPTPLQIGTRVWISDERWRLEALPELLEVAPSGATEIPVSLKVPAEASDQAPVFVDLELRQGDAVPTLVRAVIEIRADAPTVGAHAYEPIPEPLRGGLNLASLVLGASSDGPAAGLFDGVIDVAGVTLELNQPATVTLAANGQPVPIAGVILQPARGGSPSDRLSDFAIEASTDGVTFEPVLEATLSPATREQAFAFDAPIDAKALRLVPLAAAGGPNVLRARLAELQALAPPGFVLDPAGLDIADPALGGHIVRVFGLGDQTLTGEGATWPVTYPVYIPPERPERPGWVFGFRDGRVAQLSTIVWHPRQDVALEEQIRRVAVAASTVGPLGPWTDVGTFEFGEGAGPEALALPAPLWARALRFTVLDSLSGRLALPERIEIREAPGLSILGAWPDLSRRGPFESMEASAPVPPTKTSSISHDPELPTELALETLTRGEVRRGLIEDWYAIALPEETRAVTATFDGGVAPAVALTLVAEDGKEIPFDMDPADPATLVAAAGPGKWRIRVTQPVASVAVTWDTSGSVGALMPAIERMIRRLSWELDAEREAINLLPFRGETEEFLMPEWSGDRAMVLAALLAYPFSDSSSEAESAMLVAARQLSARAGQRAIVLVTDASFSDTSRNEQLWRYLAQGQVKVFSLYLPVDYDPARTRAQINLMSDWASAAGGHISRFASQADSETAYRRVAAWLNRPAIYAFELSADTSPPPPGKLTVELGATVEAGAAAPADGSPLVVSVILDASGSMLQRIGGERRIDVAKKVLRQLGENVLPEGLPVSLRVFGHDAPGSCESELFLPLMPLDRAVFAAAVDRVQSVNLARTSIAASLRASVSDLGGAAGSKIVVLITDGEETCGGDPVAEINRLREQGVDARLNIVGFAIDDPALRRTFAAWASAGAGAYFDAGDSEALGTAVRGATALSYTILDESGAELGQGLVGETIELPPGRYIIRLGGEIADAEVTLRPGATESLVVGPS